MRGFLVLWGKVKASSLLFFWCDFVRDQGWLIFKLAARTNVSGCSSQKLAAFAAVSSLFLSHAESVI
jgi:hypothetical protein